MYTLIENFCLGTRRLEIFGKLASSLRRGWVTAIGGDTVPNGPLHVEGEEGGPATLFNRETWDHNVREIAGGAKCVVPMTPDIDALRPKSPVRGQSAQNGGGGSSGGVALSGNNHQTNNMNMAPRFANNGMRNFGGMDMNPMGMGMGMGMGMDGMMGAGWSGVPVMGMNGMDPQAMMMAGMNPQMMDPQAMTMNGTMGNMMMGGQAGAFVPMMNGMGWGDASGQFAMENGMMPGMGNMGMGGQWTGY